MELNIFYVYVYLDENSIPYYIGKGKGTRIDDIHHYPINLPPKNRRIKIQENLNERDALALENLLIKLYKRKVDGGILENLKINQWAPTSGWKHSEETKRKISEKNTGKNRTLEQRLNYKKPKSKEHIEKIRLANVGRTGNENRNKKIKETMMKKRWYTDGVTCVFCEMVMQPSNFKPGRIMKGKKDVLA